MEPKELVHLFTFIASLMSCSADITLLMLIIFRSVNGLGSYKYLLMLYTIISLLFSICTALMLPEIDTTDGWIFIATAQIFPPDIGYHFLMCFSWLYLALILNLVYAFIYRYLAICKNHQMHWFTNSRHVTGLSVLFVSILATWIAQLYILVSPDDEKTEHYQKCIQSSLNVSQQAYMALNFYNEDGSIKLSSFSAVMYWIVLFTVSSSIITFAIKNINGAFTGAVYQQSAKFASMQKRLFFLLIMQTIVPITLGFTPTTFTFIFGYLQRPAGSLGVVFALCLEISQAIDPLLIIVFISEYRRALFICFRTPQQTSKIDTQTNEEKRLERQTV